MYKLINARSIQRTLDGAVIPTDPDNSDYKQYLNWVAAGNIPTPADPIPVKSAKELREAEYPSIAEQLDALLEGGATLTALKARVQATKVKYPIPI